MEYDVIIVGSGPAGSTCARKIAEKGFKVLVLDKRKEIGSPIRCGEAVDQNPLKKAGIKLTEKMYDTKIDKTICFSPNKISITHHILLFFS